MPDGPFKGMTRDKDSVRRKPYERLPVVECEKCKAFVYEGDWPAGWCKGNPDDHKR